MDIPVYLITGFLDAGKTDFINGILKDGFAAEDRTLLLCCEEVTLSCHGSKVALMASNHCSSCSNR